MSLFRSILIVLCALSLSACATVVTGEPGGVEKGNPPMPNMQNIGGEYGTMSNVAEYMTDGSVQIFSLDGPPGTPAQSYHQGTAVRMPDGGKPVHEEPNVVVYPLEELYPYPPSYQPGTVPDIQPPSEFKGGFQSPFISGDAGNKIFFNHNSSSLDGKDKEKIRAIAQVHHNGMIHVEGHASNRAEVTDPAQRHMVNLKVSMDRALSVSKELIRDGVPAAAIQTTAWGDTRPAGSEKASRRVEIYNHQHHIN